jgi:proton-dependent oligopeptide transporter, POT family
MVSSPAVQPAERPAGAVPYPTAFFGHPRGLATLFFVEFWERFSYYGMRSLLILFMTADAIKGGLGFDTLRAGAIYGLYTGSVYLMSLPGGWVADRLLGQRRSVFLGGCVIAAGHFTLALKSLPTFYLGLTLIVIGTGLLKPNVSTMVGELYPDDSARRDAGFSIFYMGINLGATVAPLICGWVGEAYNWHVGFALAGLGMLVGVVQYARGGKYLGSAGLLPNAEDFAAGTDTAVIAGGAAAPARAAASRRRALVVLAVGCGVGLLLVVLTVMGVVPISAQAVASAMIYLIIGIAIVYFLFQLLAGGLTGSEIKRTLAIFVLFVFSVLFWCGFEQAGSSLNLFAERLTDRNVFGWLMPASILQAVNPAFVILFAPVLAWLWVTMGRRNPSSPTKFAFGLIFMALGMFTMMLAALASVGHAVATGTVAATARQVSPWWLVITYLCHSLGELCLSPVGLSTVTKLAPHRKVSQMMGIWFMSLSLGNLIAGQIAGRFETLPLYQIFSGVTLVTGAAGLLLLLLARPMRNLLMGGVE